MNEHHMTLIDSDTAVNSVEANDWHFVDCRFDLKDPQAGRAAYGQGHIPGAVYAHLDEDLSGPPLTDSGRHPLPSPHALCDLFGRLGIGNDTQVVVYDAGSGAFAARLWWMLRYMGHERVAVLDGGWKAWCAAGHPAKVGSETVDPALFGGAPREDRLVKVAEVDDASVLVDARPPVRYRGDEEPLDRVGGHIPGARNYCFMRNLGENGRFLGPGILQAQLTQVLGDAVPEDAVFYCGSGVTACHNILAAVQAGLPEPRLYVGSWSEWSRDPERPVATGEEPG